MQQLQARGELIMNRTVNFFAVLAFGLSWLMFMSLPVFAADNEVTIGEGEEALEEALSEPDSESLPSSLLDDMEEFADTAQRATSNSFNRFVVQIDGFFGEDEPVEDEDKSWGRIRLGGVRSGGESVEFKGRLKVKVVLPQTEQRLRLLFSTEDDDVTGNERRGSLESETDQDAALALRFVRTLSDQLRLKFDIGARIRDSEGQVFGRVSASNTGDLFWGFDYRISNNLFLFSASGFENKFKIDVRRPINNESNIFFRNSLTIDSRNGVSGASVTEVAGFYADLSSQSAIAFEGLFNFVSSRDDEFDTRFLGSEYRIRYRRNVWRPWFYYEVWPTISILAATNREISFGGLLRAEVLFGQF